MFRYFFSLPTDLNDEISRFASPGIFLNIVQKSRPLSRKLLRGDKRSAILEVCEGRKRCTLPAFTNPFYERILLLRPENLSLQKFEEETSLARLDGQAGVAIILASQRSGFEEKSILMDNGAALCLAAGRRTEISAF